MEQEASLTFFAQYSFARGQGHWYGFQSVSNDVVSIVDVDAGSKRLEVPMNALSSLLEEDDCSTWETAMRSGDQRSQPREVVTPLVSCRECGAPLTTAHAVSGRLHTLGGMEEVSMVIKRCSKKTCRVHHRYNHRKVDGDKYHSLDLDRMDYVFVNSRLGFCRQFLTTISWWSQS